MSIARRVSMALAIAGLVIAPTAATSQRSSPGYSYRLSTTGRITEPSGRTTDYVVMSGHALVTEKAGRLDIDQASRGAVAGKDSYILYDSTSMTIVAPKSRQIVRLSLDTLERALAAAGAPGPRVAVSAVTVDIEKLGPGEPMFGMATTKYRLTQDYTLATNAPSAGRNGTEHVVRELWIADERKGLRNPFARLDAFRVAARGDFGELLAKTAEAERRMSPGVPLKIVTTTTSTSSRNAVSRSVTTMEVADLQAENVDDDILAAPTDYRVVAVSDLARSASSAQGSRSGEPAKGARPATGDGSAAAAKGDFVKILHGMGRRP